MVETLNPALSYPWVEKFWTDFYSESQGPTYMEVIKNFCQWTICIVLSIWAGASVHLRAYHCYLAGATSSILLHIQHSLVTTWMGVYLQTGKSCLYITNQQVKLAFHPSVVGKLSPSSLQLTFGNLPHKNIVLLKVVKWLNNKQFNII